MKKKQRDRAIRQLLGDLRSADFDTREHALFQLALMLQRAQAAPRYADATDLYSENLSRELRRIRLSPAEQIQIADAIGQLIANYPVNRATAIWALAELHAEIGLASVLPLIRDPATELGGEAAYQVCRALGRWLLHGAAHLQPALRLQLSDVPLAQLQRWRESGDERLARAAESATDSLRLLRGGEANGL